MNKKILIGSILGLGMLTPAAAFAATDITFLTLDGLSNATVEAGDDVDAKVTFDLTAGDDVESMSWELVGSGLPQTCVDISDRLVDGTFNVSFPIDTTGSTEGTWDVTVKAYGINGSGADNNCGNGPDDTATFTDRLTITEEANADNDNANNTGNSGGGLGSNMPSWLAALIALLKPEPAPTPAPTGNTAKCAEVNAKLVGTMDYTYNQANVQLQGFLLSEGMSIPALAAGASFGYKGEQTNAALAQFKAAHQCI